MDDQNKIHVPCIVKHTSKSCDIFVPDFGLTIHGRDYFDTFANAVTKISAIYYYNLERNLEIAIDTTFSKLQEMCKDESAFATYIQIMS